MKRFFVISLGAMFSVAVMASLKMPAAKVVGNLSDYTYFRVVSAGGVTADGPSGSVGFGGPLGFYGVSGGSTKTVVPSDAIIGYLMKHGFNVISSIPDNIADKTLIVSYGYAGGRRLSLDTYASDVIIQMRNAVTQELVATFEAEGGGANEADCILQAINSAMALFRYNYAPKVTISIDEAYKSSIMVSIGNLTPSQINSVTLRILYYQNKEQVYEQTCTVNSTINSGYILSNKYIKRDKPARNNKYAIKMEVVDYK